MRLFVSTRAFCARTNLGFQTRRSRRDIQGVGHSVRHLRIPKIYPRLCSGPRLMRRAHLSARAKPSLYGSSTEAPMIRLPHRSSTSKIFAPSSAGRESIPKSKPRQKLGTGDVSRWCLHTSDCPQKLSSAEFPLCPDFPRRRVVSYASARAVNKL